MSHRETGVHARDLIPLLASVGVAVYHMVSVACVLWVSVIFLWECFFSLLRSGFITDEILDHSRRLVELSLTALRAAAVSRAGVSLLMMCGHQLLPQARQLVLWFHQVKVALVCLALAVSSHVALTVVVTGVHPLDAVDYRLCVRAAKEGVLACMVFNRL